MSDSLDPLLDTAAVSRIFLVCTATVARWQRLGKIRAVRVGRELRFRRRDIERLLELPDGNNSSATRKRQSPRERQERKNA